MKLSELRELKAGDRVRLVRGEMGTVTKAGTDGTGYHYVSVEWDNYSEEDYRHFSRYSADWTDRPGRLSVRRLHQVRCR